MVCIFFAYLFSLTTFRTNSTNVLVFDNLQYFDFFLFIKKLHFTQVYHWHTNQYISTICAYYFYYLRKGTLKLKQPL